MSLLPEILCSIARSLHRRGYAHGSTGNLSVRTDGEVWLTPTGRSLENLSPADLACLSLDGEARNANRPTKEFPFHLAIYRARPDLHAVVHLHSFYATALSCLEQLPEPDVLPALTPYYFMRVHPLAVVSYHRPGAPSLAEEIGAAITRANVLLLRNHGLVACGRTLEEAADRAEELEQTARLHFFLKSEHVRVLSPQEIRELL
ncbi:MAG: putative aldolase class 2 protein [Bryobacteraceae bacterium]|nr:MAG: putative aldolase class 2 protein [Bryobacteraceae bacterium]